MNPPLVQALPGQLPQGFCPTGAGALQAFYDEIIARTQFSLNPAYAFYNYGNVAPTPENRSYPWVRLDSSGQMDRVYSWFGAAGMWLSPNSVLPSDASRRIWVGAPGDITTYDGGNSSSPTLWSGPMWEIDTTFAARFPVGVGTFAGGTSVAVQGTGGSDEHTLTIAEMPAHNHPGSNLSHTIGTAPGGSINGADYDTDNKDPIELTIASQGGGEAFEIIPPYIGVYFIKRTTRQFYAV